MLKRLAVAIVLVCAGTAAVADAADDCTKSNDWPEKIRSCTAVIAGQPRAGWAYINRSYAYERSGQYSRALADGNKAVELSPQDAIAYVNRAAAYIGLADFSRALADTNTAIRMAPGNALPFVNRAFIYEKLGDRDRAVADYRRTLEIDPNRQYAKDALKRLGAEP